MLIESRYTKKGKRSYDVLVDERTKRSVNGQPLCAVLIKLLLTLSRTQLRLLS